MFMSERQYIGPISLHWLLCMISNQRTNKNHVIPVRPPVSLRLWHKAHSKVLLVLQNQGSKNLGVHIQPKPISNKKSEGGWGLWAKFKEVSHKECLHRKWSLTNPLPTIIRLQHIRCLIARTHLCRCLKHQTRAKKSTSSLIQQTSRCTADPTFSDFFFFF